MNISILSVFKDLYIPFFNTSLIGRARAQGTITMEVDDFFSFVSPKERIDAPTFGPGAGMLIKPEVVQKAIMAKEAQRGPAYKLFLSPQGKKLNQRLLKKIAAKVLEKGHVIIVSSRYEGMDARVEQEYADEIVSVGDFVVLGGDIPAMLLIEGLVRLIPGVVGRQESVEAESFSGAFIDYPEYTTPVQWQGRSVPEIIRSGNHGQIKAWRQEYAARASVMNHFSWVRSCMLTHQEKELAARFIPAHYIVLMHSEVLVQDNQVGTSSVTSLDIHDIARSCKTYGVKQFFIVTPLIDQQKIVKTLLDFWQKGEGVEYNPSRFQAVKQVELYTCLDEVIAHIAAKDGKKPLLIATSARESNGQTITYFDQATVWRHEAPVLILLGTGKGLAPDLLARCDYHLIPVEGFSDYNHLSVRSAAAIILDRWLAINPSVQ